jgi:hypothetical protein
MVAATAKAFNVSPMEVMHQWSWQNMSLFCATLPTYNTDQRKPKTDTIDADQPITPQQAQQLQAIFG